MGIERLPKKTQFIKEKMLPDKMPMTMGTMNPKQTTFIGRASVTSMPGLPGGLGTKGRLLTLGHMAKPPGPPTLARSEKSGQQTSFGGIDYLVAGTDCNIDKLLKTIRHLKETEPSLKIVLADSAELPVLQGQERPCGVESVMTVSQEQMEAGMALFLAFLMEGKIETGPTIAVAITNLSPELLG